LLQSAPLVTYLKRYLMKVVLLHHSTFICAWYFLSSNILYGTTHLLSIWKPPFLTKSAFVRLLYTAKPFLLTIVPASYGLGKCFEHFFLFHAGTFWVVFTTRAMYHMFGDESIAKWLYFWIRYLCSDIFVNHCCGWT